MNQSQFGILQLFGQKGEKSKDTNYFCFVFGKKHFKHERCIFWFYATLSLPHPRSSHPYIRKGNRGKSCCLFFVSFIPLSLLLEIYHHPKTTSIEYHVHWKTKDQQIVTTCSRMYCWRCRSYCCMAYGIYQNTITTSKEGI